MAEYGGKQRNQLSKAISSSESQDVQLQRFADNRPQTNSQLNLIHSIQKKSNNTGLPDNLKSGIENLSGYSMDDVRVHYNSDKPAQLNALAYAQGTDIHVAPGQEKHLPHEAWHVVQQKQGRVQPTIQKQGVNVSDNEGLEKEADVMGENTIKSSVKTLSSLTQNNSSNYTIQYKGKTPLMKQVIGTDGLLEWAIKAIAVKEDRLLCFNSVLQNCFKKINDYDRMTNGSPLVQHAFICEIINSLDQYEINSEHDQPKIKQLREILIKEKNITYSQFERLKKYTDSDDAPYLQMTDEGMLWSVLDFEHNVTKMGKTGKEYFQHLSQLNLDSMENEEEESEIGMNKDYIDFVKAATDLLSNAKVNHYTTSTRVKTIMGGTKEMKSKMLLEHDLPEYKHNTSPYDDFGLGNSGFLFFFIESPNAPFRHTRFGSGDDGGTPVRISIPINESGLLEKGWIMLSDFAQREYPVIAAKADGSHHTSWLSTRENTPEVNKKKADGYTDIARKFELGVRLMTESEIEDMVQIEDSGKRQAFSAVTSQGHGDKESKQIYTAPRIERNSTRNLFDRIEIPDRIFNNILVGEDIIKGLAQRAGLEVMRIKNVNPELGDSMIKLRGDDLMSLMLKDLCRPQAMIPNELTIKDEYVQIMG